MLYQALKYSNFYKTTARNAASHMSCIAMSLHRDRPHLIPVLMFRRAKKVLGEASAPPVRPITLGAGDKVSRWERRPVPLQHDKSS